MAEPTATVADQRFRAPRSIFWTGLLIRVLYITLAHTYRVRLAQDHLQFGWEMGRVARALATGYGYADPFTGHTGPTAWVPPLYPLFIAAVFKLFGVYTPLSAWVIFTINSIFSAATAPAVYEIAARSFQREGPARARKIALWSAWLWALYPGAMQYAVRWVWDMAVTAFLFTRVLVLALRTRAIGENPPTLNPQTLARWAEFGLLWGCIALLNSTILLFLPVCGLWMALGAIKQRLPLAPVLVKATIAGTIFLACLAPWTIRNYRVFHAFVPIRGNLGAELHDSILESYNGFTVGTRVPICEVCPDYIEYKQMGEYAWVQREGRIAREIILTHKQRFFQYALKRFYFYWISVPKPYDHGFLDEFLRVLNYSFASIAALLGLALALHRRVPASILFAWAFALLPLMYYFVTVQARFRHPLEPLMTILIVYLFQSAERKPNPRTIS